MGNMARMKGQRGELEVVKLLQPTVTSCYMMKGLEVPQLARNLSQTRDGGFDIAGLEWMALEVKRQETLNVKAWWEQTCRQAGTDEFGMPLKGQENKSWFPESKRLVFVNKNPTAKEESSHPGLFGVSKEDLISRDKAMAGSALIRTPILFYRKNKEPWSVRMIGRLFCDKTQFRTPVTVNSVQFLAWFELKLNEILGTMVSLAEDLPEDVRNQ